MLRFLTTAIISVALAACNPERPAEMTIFDSAKSIAESPQSWMGHTVKLRGHVTSIYGVPLLLNTAVYEFTDGAGTVYVLSQKNPPAVGDRFILIGKVSVFAILGDFTAGWVVRESARL